MISLAHYLPKSQARSRPRLPGAQRCGGRYARSLVDWGHIRYARNGDASIAYRVGGEGPIELLFITGFVSHLELVFELPAARRFFDRLASFARVIVFDKRGMGLSDRDAGAYTIENVAGDAVAVLDAAGSERAALLGVSEGGPASVMLAATRPDRVSSMALYGTYARLTQTEGYPEGIPLDVLRENWSAFSASWGSPASLGLFAPSMAGDPELREWWGRMMRSGASPGVIETLGEMYERLDVRGLLDSVSVPSLILYRADDQTTPPALSKALADGIPGARLVELPGEDHLFCAADQDALLNEVEEFLTGRPAAAEPERALATVLFTDLVDSTATAAELGDRRWRSLLEQFNRLTRRELDRHDGRLVKTTGDGLLATFDGPARGVRAALAIRDVGSSLGVRTRAGLHTGECELIADDIGGLAVHIASRVEGLAEPDQVATTGTVADLVVGSGLEFRDIGPHALKGVPGEWRINVVAGDAES